jgi:hypothetical protein
LKIAALACSAALLGLMSITPANALPASSTTHHGASTEQNVQLVKHKPGHYKKWYGNKYYGPKHQFRPGGRYSHAPKGWHRHGSRPAYWATRGCITVGPIWFCP